MQIEEFTKRTGYYPDTIHYNVIQREYERQDDEGHDIWANKDEFCTAYRRNDDGLAEMLQREANEELWRMEEKHRKAMTESANRAQKLSDECRTLEDRVRKAERSLAEAEAENARLEADIVTANKTVRELKAGGIKADMLDALRQMAHEEWERDEIGTALVGFDYLLRIQQE